MLPVEQSIVYWSQRRIPWSYLAIIRITNALHPRRLQSWSHSSCPKRRNLVFQTLILWMRFFASRIGPWSWWMFISGSTRYRSRTLWSEAVFRILTISTIQWITENIFVHWSLYLNTWFPFSKFEEVVADCHFCIGLKWRHHRVVLIPVNAVCFDIPIYPPTSFKIESKPKTRSIVNITKYYL